MQKELATLLTAFVASTAALTAHAFDSITAYNKPLSSIKGFSISQPALKKGLLANNSGKNSLEPINSTVMNGQTFTRYQQTYQGIPVIGKQIIVKQPQGAFGFSAETTATKVELAKNLNVNVKPSFSEKAAIQFATQQYKQHGIGQIVPGSESAQKQIRIINKKPGLYYDVSFNVTATGGAPKHMHTIVTANESSTLKSVLSWDSIQNYNDTGPGGNVKTVKFGDGKELWYGENGLSALDVSRSGNTCTMDNGRVALINLQQDQDNTEAYQYVCGTNKGDPIDGAFSPSDDAYYFGDVIINMYKNWYNTDALQRFGQPMKLIMRVHYGTDYDNAFWNGSSMTFGDGSRFYPLVSLDVAGHEVSHGFTEQHSGLEYHDQPGSLNEAFSDMAGQAVRAYLLSEDPALYEKLYYNENAVDWGLGETISKGAKDKALRYMNDPSEDGRSADCLDKTLAKQSGANCKITYQDVVDNALGSQGMIVHTGSGVFNKAFYLLSQQIGIKDAFRAFKDANAKYWTQSSDFKDAACGVVQAAKDDGIRQSSVVTVFNQVGVSTKQCTSEQRS